MFTLIFAYMAATADARFKRPETFVAFDQVKAALTKFQADCGRYPSTEEGLQALTSVQKDCLNWGPDPYLTEIPKDMWGHALVYYGADKTFTLQSLGKDGRPGGRDDDLDLSYTAASKKMKLYHRIEKAVSNRETAKGG